MRISDIIGGIFFTAFGLILFIFRNRLSDIAIVKWYESYPQKKIFEKGYIYFFTFGGIAFLIFGILLLLGIIKSHN